MHFPYQQVPYPCSHLVSAAFSISRSGYCVVMLPPSDFNCISLWIHLKFMFSYMKFLQTVLIFGQLSQTRVTWEEGTAVEELSSSNWAKGTSLRHWLVIDMGGPSLFWTGGPGLCKKGAEQAMRKQRQLSSVVPSPVSRVVMIVICKPVIPFFPRWCFLSVTLEYTVHLITECKSSSYIPDTKWFGF